MIFQNLKKIDVKKKLAFSLILFFLSIGIIYFFVLDPTLVDIKVIKAEIIDQKIDLERKLIKENNMVKLSEKLKSIEPQSDKFNNIYISKNRELEFITTLEGLAKKNLIDQKIALDPAKGKIENNIKKVPITLTLQGTFPNLYHYLKNVEGMSYYINFDSVQISGGSGLKPQPKNGEEIKASLVNMKLQGETYWK